MSSAVNYEVRVGALEDLGGIVDIYNHFVDHTAVTFDTQPYDVSTRRPWFDRFGRDPRHRLLVAVASNDSGALAGQVLAYAASGRFHEKAAYETSVETSIYVRVGFERRGIGTALYRRLLDEVASAGAHRAYAGVTQPNDASRRLHESLGFAVAARYGEVGFKLGRYWDVHWFEKRF